MNDETRMTVILADADKQNRDLNKCMDCDKPSEWIIFGCLTYCDECLPTHFAYLRNEWTGGGWRPHPNSLSIDNRVSFRKKSERVKKEWGKGPECKIRHLYMLDWCGQYMEECDACDYDCHPSLLKIKVFIYQDGKPRTLQLCPDCWDDIVVFDEEVNDWHKPWFGSFFVSLSRSTEEKKEAK